MPRTSYPRFLNHHNDIRRGVQIISPPPRLGFIHHKVKGKLMPLLNYVIKHQAIRAFGGLGV
jgi:hypothetical protein